MIIGHLFWFTFEVAFVANSNCSSRKSLTLWLRVYCVYTVLTITKLPRAIHSQKYFRGKQRDAERSNVQLC